MSSGPSLVHGASIAAGSRAALIRGPSGSGKSDLALRCLMHPATALLPEAARLVADDQVLVERRRGVLFARAPKTIGGKIEVRGLGVIDVPAAPEDGTPLTLLVEFAAAGGIERLPDPAPEAELLGLLLPVLRLAPFEASAAAKVLLALRFGLPPRGRA